ncbi:cupin domain-containing protein [Blautia liquoris]|uniref:Cupin domain-containing protein n=1 Tax=Blautia liquoris TaxID=2779518 RepID=A0A7M2RFN3_9FIRM|nr:cupin domain-containing protein [Blautia liquoris]QOV18784.1 cupin domain-containing protein [Blautia liquoris]
MYKLNMKLQRTKEDEENARKDRLESAKNSLVPGARIIRGGDAIPVYVNEIACREWFYPLSEVNDIGMFSYIEKDENTDTDRPWATRFHPDVNVYYYILEGKGKVCFGDGGTEFETEIFEFQEQELVIIPREVPYRMEGGWKAICFHSRTGVYGKAAGTVRYPHPVVYMDKPARPTEEEEKNLKDPGTYVCYNQTMSKELSFGKTSGIKSSYLDLQKNREDLNQVVQSYDVNHIYEEVTPVDEQTRVIENIEESEKNACVLGARVLKRADAPAVYNANAGLRQSSYPLTWTDDIAICNLAEKLAESDKERPFDSHAHPDIEEYKFILSGSGSVTIGVGDETCEEERYEFKAGDLVILPRGLAHVDAGGYTALYFHSKQSVFGKTPGDSLYPHIAYVYTRPPRPTKEEEEALNDPGTFIKMNSRETYNVYCPNPVLRVEKNPTDMTHLRPDLFPEKKEK